MALRQHRIDSPGFARNLFPLLLALLTVATLAFAEKPAAQAPAAAPLVSPAFAQHLEAGRSAYEHGKQDDAIREFREAIKLDPNNSMAHLWLGRALGRKTEKASALRQAFMVGNVRTEFEKAVQLDPRNVEARCDLMEFYMEAPGMFGGGMDKARQQADAIAKIDSAEGHSAQARLAEKEKHYDIAEREYRAALDAKPDSPGYRKDLDEFLKKHGPQSKR